LARTLCTHCGAVGAPPIDPITAQQPSSSAVRTSGVLRTFAERAPSVHSTIHSSPTSSLGSLPLLRS